MLSLPRVLRIRTLFVSSYYFCSATFSKGLLSHASCERHQPNFLLLRNPGTLPEGNVWYHVSDMELSFVGILETDQIYPATLQTHSKLHHQYPK